MRQYENINIVLDMPDSKYLEGISEVVVTVFEPDSGKKLTLTDDRITKNISENTLTFSLTQEETAVFGEQKPCRLQVNILYKDGQRIISKFAKISFSATDFSEVM